MMDLTEDRLVISKSLSDLDETVVAFTTLLDQNDITYAIVSGYLAILTGRSRGTEDIDVLLEPLSENRTGELTDEFEADGYWGTAMPLDEMYAMLSNGSRIRVAEEDRLVPNFELFFATSEFEQRVLTNRLTAEVGGEEIAVSPIEEQIAYKLRLAQDQGVTTGKDFEDALHLYVTFDGQFNRSKLEDLVEDLGVTEYYDELRDA
jgi:hypothetical protein